MYLFSTFSVTGCYNVKIRWSNGSMIRRKCGNRSVLWDFHHLEYEELYVLGSDTMKLDTKLPLFLSILLTLSNGYKRHTDMEDWMNEWMVFGFEPYWQQGTFCQTIEHHVWEDPDLISALFYVNNKQKH